MQKLTEDLQSGKITPEEFTKKSQEFSNLLREKTEGITKTAIVEAGYMVTVTDILGNIEPIPSNDVKWFEDSYFYK